MIQLTLIQASPSLTRLSKLAAMPALRALLPSVMMLAVLAFLHDRGGAEMTRLPRPRTK